MVDIPVKEVRRKKETYKTVPLGIILTKNNIITICSEHTSILDHFHDEKTHNFSVKTGLQFVYQIMLHISGFYQQTLTSIDKKRREFEEHIEKINDEEDLISLHELESTLVYFVTSLRGNSNVLNKLARSEKLKHHKNDKELLDDVIIEHNQAIEMAQIYKDIIDGTRELMASIINARLNNVMKQLTSVTIILSIPTVISGMYGMNVDAKWVPFANAVHGFGIIGLITAIICFALMIYLKNKKML